MITIVAILFSVTSPRQCLGMPRPAAAYASVVVAVSYHHWCLSHIASVLLYISGAIWHLLSIVHLSSCLVARTALLLKLARTKTVCVDVACGSRLKLLRIPLMHFAARSAQVSWSSCKFGTYLAYTTDYRITWQDGWGGYAATNCGHTSKYHKSLP